MRLKYNAPSPNHRRVIPNPDPNRVETDPEELVWEASNNFVVDIPDGLARGVLDGFPGEFTEAPEEEPYTREVVTRTTRGSEGETWVEKAKSSEGDESSTGPPSEIMTASRRAGKNQ